MKTNNNVKFPYYSGNIKFTKVMGYVSIQDFINAHKNPRPDIQAIMDKVVLAEGLEKRKLKHKLFSFTPSVVIKLGSKRKYSEIAYYTGLMQLDFDKIETIEKAIDLKRYLFREYPQIICSYLSPSGTGVKCLMKITTPTSKDQYKSLHKAVTSEMEGTGYFDTATNNPMLPLFLSIDKDILYRDYSDCYPWVKEDNSKPEYINLNSERSYVVQSGDSWQFKSIIRTTSDRVNTIIDNGHPQVRTAALILGSRVGAGYIDIASAENLILGLIENNSYLHKGIEGYKETALWAIREGSKNPKFFNN